jgi:diaminohydroxyphosphoribosylaminopyrimidine deaminase/5-amino-6-(5-phosphoribosylamino)uracil reductase
MADWSATDQQWMRRALELAATARDQTFPNPCVGCVIVSASGQLLGEGYHHAAGLPHAEVEALTAAPHDVRGATCYVTLEPCNHHGRTGPCSEALIRAGVARVVIATQDPHQTASGGAQRLRDAGIQVDLGLMGEESRLLNAAFVTFHQLARPLVTLKWAMTLDGCTAVPSGDSKWITSEAARAEVHRRRARHGAVLAGIGTVLHDNARFSARPPGSFTIHRVVLDSTLRLPLDAAFLDPVPNQPALILCSDAASAEREQALRARGADVIRLGETVTPQAVLQELARRGIQSVYIEGGRRVAGSFLAAGLADRVESWIAPKLSGGGPTHLGPTSRTTPLTTMADAQPLHAMTLSQWGPDILIEGWLNTHLFAEKPRNPSLSSRHGRHSPSPGIHSGDAENLETDPGSGSNKPPA